VSDIYRDAWERLCKWRQVFAGWQLGTRHANDAECQAVRDHREVTICLRAEVNALTRVLLEKGVISQQDLARLMAEEAEYLNAAYERKFPGMKADLSGITYTLPEAAQTMKGWRP
jgi:hypothetical protein